ncbi:hypothetical protein ABN115_00235, partial [Providencia rettgeri]|uniref:hypothetical protein n=1 Tax=Providencia rettgeri TaxID=587 RepID=UPI0032DAE874
VTYFCMLHGMPSLAALPQRELFRVNPLSITLWRCWLLSVTQVTYFCMLHGMPSLAALPQRELFRVNLFNITRIKSV